ncbi:hypothetical protein IKD56_05380 [bacterium]|nr:hypothetical protein [bacterium]MBR4003986.1 hypothetical protein [Clostridia bacterium]
MSKLYKATIYLEDIENKLDSLQEIADYFENRINSNIKINFNNIECYDTTNRLHSSGHYNTFYRIIELERFIKQNNRHFHNFNFPIIIFCKTLERGLKFAEYLINIKQRNNIKLVSKIKDNGIIKRIYIFDNGEKIQLALLDKEQDWRGFRYSAAYIDLDLSSQYIREHIYPYGIYKVQEEICF